jgi:hypothetical protein
MFTRSDVKRAEHEMAEMILKTFGEIWTPAEDAMYHGCDIYLKTMIPLDNALWELCQRAKHKGALRAFGKIEIRDVGETMRLAIFYKQERKDEQFN